MNVGRFRAILVKEYRQFFRDRVTTAVVFVIPAVQLLLFGYAINFDVKRLPTAVLDLAGCRESREVLQDFRNSAYFKIEKCVADYRALNEVLSRGEVKAAIVFPSDFKKRIKARKGVAAEVIFDASDPLVARTAIATAHGIGLYRAALFAGGDTRSAPFEIRTRGWYNPGLRSANFMVPGLIGVIMQLITTMLTAMAIVRERERGTLEQLLVSPVSKSELVLGKLTFYVALGYADITLALVIARFAFGVHVAGNVFVLYTLALLFLASTLGFGLLISTVAKSQQQAMQMSFLIFLPSLMLSGFFFPVAAMPGVIRPLSYFIPLTYFLEICRGVILKGQGFAELYRQTFVLAVMGAGILSVAIARTRKREG